MWREIARVAVAVVAAASMLVGCGASETGPIIPETAAPISPSLGDFFAAWNHQAKDIGAPWRVDSLPNVSEKPAFEHKLARNLDLVGYLNPSTRSVVLVSLFASGAPTKSPTSQVDFDVDMLRNAASVLMRATSPAQSDDVRDVLGRLGLGSAAQFAATNANSTPTDVTEAGRIIRLQRFPTVLVVTVLAQEPWEFVGTPGDDAHHAGH